MTRNFDPKTEVVMTLFQLGEDGSVLENVLFHRPWDKLHSRCVEYPFAASKLGDARLILDVGTGQADPVWISWLEKLPIEVHATDYDDPGQVFNHIKFHQCDVREIPLAEATFDKIFAVSVIEHIGLDNPQVRLENVPEIDTQGDLAAVEELARLLKPGGELIMTLPFGLHDGLILEGQARNYTQASLSRFDKVLEISKLDYYEYQHKDIVELFVEYPKKIKLWEHIMLRLGGKLDSLFGRNIRDVIVSPEKFKRLNLNNLPGAVTWRRIPLSESRAEHRCHLEGVVCGVWKKPQFTD